MGNTCYVVATVTIADWRMTVGFRALLMAVCRRPTPSRSLIPDTGSPIWVHLSPLALSVSALHRFRIARRPTPALPNYLRNLRFSRPDFVHLGLVTQIASEILFREHIAKIDRNRTAPVTFCDFTSVNSLDEVEKII